MAYVNISEGTTAGTPYLGWSNSGGGVRVATIEEGGYKVQDTAAILPEHLDQLLSLCLAAHRLTGHV